MPVNAGCQCLYNLNCIIYIHKCTQNTHKKVTTTNIQNKQECTCIQNLMHTKSHSNDITHSINILQLDLMKACNNL